MPQITIDGKEYDTDTLTDEAKAQLISLQVCDRKIADLNAEAAILQTARNSYAASLRTILNEND